MQPACKSRVGRALELEGRLDPVVEPVVHGPPGPEYAHHGSSRITGIGNGSITGSSRVHHGFFPTRRCVESAMAGAPSHPITPHHTPSHSITLMGCDGASQSLDLTVQ
eukprot:12545187-Alexandrium_andersonii.AAC.1